MIFKKTVRLMGTMGLHFTLNSLPPESRRNIGTTLVNKHDSLIGQKLLGWYAAGRPVDAFLISFPKSGRTWLRLMLGQIFVHQFSLDHPEIQKKMLKLEPLAELNPAVPRVRVTHDDEPHWKKPHELETTKIQFKQSKIIFLSRDPRDVVVSAYFEQEKRAAMWMEEAKRAQDRGEGIDLERLKPFQGDLSTFLYHDVGSFDTVLRYYNIWADNRHASAGFLLIRYEDLHENPKRELGRMLKFLEVPDVSDEILSEVIEHTSFKNMRKMEVENAFDSRHLKPADEKDENSFKTRRGKVGGFVDYFNQIDITYMNDKISKNLSEFYGYNP